LLKCTPDLSGDLGSPASLRELHHRLVRTECLPARVDYLNPNAPGRANSLRNRAATGVSDACPNSLESNTVTTPELIGQDVPS
jgi:hypothetical protein